CARRVSVPSSASASWDRELDGAGERAGGLVAHVAVGAAAYAVPATVREVAPVSLAHHELDEPGAGGDVGEGHGAAAIAATVEPERAGIEARHVHRREPVAREGRAAARTGDVA